MIGTICRRLDLEAENIISAESILGRVPNSSQKNTQRFLSLPLFSSATDKMGPSLMPKIVFGLMTFLCVLLFIDFFRNRRGVLIQKATAKMPEEEQAKRKVSTRRGLISIIGIFGFIALVTKLGFFLTSVAYLLFEFFLLDTKRNTRKTILFIVLAIAFSGIVYYVFRYQVYVRLPKGILG